jgi:uncharacterized repeat protein (TIGR03803 family)
MARSKRLRTFTAKFGLAIVICAGILVLSLMAASVQAQTFSVLYGFPNSSNVGQYPFSGLVLDHAGRLYGTCYTGRDGYGTVYRVARAGSGWMATGLYSFQGEPDGAYPMSNVAFGPDGTLYGTTAFGGTGGNEGFGTVFNVRPPASICKTALCPWTETVLYRFTGGSDGGFGEGLQSNADTLVFDQAGNIYGTTPMGGAHGGGVVFKLIRSGESWTESVLWSFGSDGGSPLSGVIFDSAGNLYGTAAFGGANGDGVVYELSPSGSGWTQRTLYSFGHEDGGGFPYGGVTMDAQGNLYGTTGGAQGAGEAYELTLSDGSWTVSRRQVFTGETTGPYDTPTLDSQGNLYGTSSAYAGNGEVFKLTPSGNGWIYTHLYEFTGSQDSGSSPIGGVVFDSNGNLYGTTSAGGPYGNGIVWEITP